MDGVIRGLHEVAKHIDAEKAKICFLATSCNEPAYQKLVKGLCLEKNVPLVEVQDNKLLGEWAGVCKVDADGNPKKYASVWRSATRLVSMVLETQNRTMLSRPA